jgi:hypothetical protein
MANPEQLWQELHALAELQDRTDSTDTEDSKEAVREFREITPQARQQLLANLLHLSAGRPDLCKAITAERATDGESKPGYLQHDPSPLAVVEATEQHLARLVGRSIHNKNPQLSDVVVDVTGPETVHLSGKVSSYHLRQVATSIARHVPGVRFVSDGIHVESSAPPPKGHAALQRQVAKAKVTRRGT